MLILVLGLVANTDTMDNLRNMEYMPFNLLDNLSDGLLGIMFLDGDHGLEFYYIKEGKGDQLRRSYVRY